MFKKIMLLRETLSNTITCLAFKTSVCFYSKKWFKIYMKHDGRKKIALCYPEKPEYFHILYPTLHMLGYTITNDPKTKADIVIDFHDVTIQPDDPERTLLTQTYKVINARCTDISKKRVGRIFEEIFGYSLDIDPQKHVGLCVKKSDANAMHDGCVIQCPVIPDDTYVYQKLIDNQCDAHTVIDIRVPILGKTIPYSILRYKDICDRFDHTNKIDVRTTTDVLSEHEIEKILAFCEAFGLEYGEIDIVRDNKDNRLYIVDVNNTPSGPRPGGRMSAKDYTSYIRMVAQVFSTVFTGEDQTTKLPLVQPFPNVTVRM